MVLDLAQLRLGQKALLGRLCVDLLRSIQFRLLYSLGGFVQSGDCPFLLLNIRWAWVMASVARSERLQIGKIVFI
jgi:hypothetical protein